MRKNAILFLAMSLMAAGGCAVIAGNADTAVQAQQQELKLNFVETLRNEASLRGEGLKEPSSAQAPVSELQQPNSVFADAFRVYVTDIYTSTAVPRPRIFVFNRGERTVPPLGVPAPPSEGSLAAPSGIAVDATGVIFVSDSLQGRVFGYDRNGRLLMVIGRFGELSHPSGLAVDNARNRLYVADSHAQQVKAFTTQGAFQFDIGNSGKPSEDFKFPAAVALDRAGNLYVLDGSRRRVNVYDPDGRFIKIFGLSSETLGRPVKPRGIAVDSDGHIYVADSAGDTILIFDKNGLPLAAWGRTGSLRGDFRTPAGIFIDDRDTIYIADQMNSRVQVFQYMK